MLGEKDLDKSLRLSHALGNEGSQTEIPKSELENEFNYYQVYEESEPTTFLTFFEDYEKFCDSEVAKGYPTPREFAVGN